MKLAQLLASNFRFLKNRESILYNNPRQAAADFWKVSGASVLFQVGLAVLVAEFGFPTPDIVYDIKKVISPDFDLYTKYGELAEHRLDFENRLRSIQREEEKVLEKRLYQKSPEARFGGTL